RRARARPANGRGVTKVKSLSFSHSSLVQRFKIDAPTQARNGLLRNYGTGSSASVSKGFPIRKTCVVILVASGEHSRRFASSLLPTPGVISIASANGLRRLRTAGEG